MKKFLFIFFFLTLNPKFQTLNCFAQQNRIDSLLTVLQTATEDSTKAKTLHKIAWAYIYSNPDTAFILAQKEYEIVEKIGASPDEALAKSGKIQMASALHTQGVTFHIKGDYPKALKYYHKSLKISEELGKKKEWQALTIISGLFIGTKVIIP